MTLADETKTIFDEVKAKLHCLHYVNLCQEGPPENEYYVHRQVIDGEQFTVLVNPQDKKLFFPSSTFKKIAQGTLAEHFGPNQQFVLTHDGLVKWEPIIDGVHLGDIAEFLDDYQPQHI